MALIIRAKVNIIVMGHKITALNSIRMGYLLMLSLIVLYQEATVKEHLLQVHISMGPDAIMDQQVMAELMHIHMEDKGMEVKDKPLMDIRMEGKKVVGMIMEEQVSKLQF